MGPDPLHIQHDLFNVQYALWATFWKFSQKCKQKLYKIKTDINLAKQKSITFFLEITNGVRT